jgi:hypothetical protein
MKRSFLLLAIVAASCPPLAHAADKKICINPRWSYQARALDNDTVIARSTLGSDHRELQLSTTCHDLKNARTISLSSTFACVGMGDDVVGTTIDGQREHCRIARVAPYVPTPAAPPK